MRSCGASHWFAVEADPSPDALLRVLGPFAVQQADLASVRHDQSALRCRVELQVMGLEPARADLLRLRLAQLPIVRSVDVRLTATASAGRALAEGAGFELSRGEASERTNPQARLGHDGRRLDRSALGEA
jgi:hypothetical protein